MSACACSGLQVSDQHSAVQALLTAATVTAAENIASHASEIAAKDAAHAELTLKHTDISAQVHLCLVCPQSYQCFVHAADQSNISVCMTSTSSVGRWSDCLGVGRGRACGCAVAGTDRAARARSQSCRGHRKLTDVHHECSTARTPLDPGGRPPGDCISRCDDALGLQRRSGGSGVCGSQSS